MNKTIELSDKNVQTALNAAYQLSNEQYYNQFSFYRKRPLKWLVDHWFQLSNGESDFSFQGFGFQEIGQNLDEALQFLKFGEEDHFKNKQIHSWVTNNLEKTVEEWINNFKSYKNEFENGITLNRKNLIYKLQSFNSIKNDELIKSMISDPLLVDIMTAGGCYASLKSYIEDYLYQNAQPVLVLKSNVAKIKKCVFGTNNDKTIVEKDATYAVRFKRCYDRGFYIENKEKNVSEYFNLSDLFNGNDHYLYSLDDL